MTQRQKLLFFVTEDWYFCSHRMTLATVAQQKGYQVFVVTRVNKDADKITSAGFTLIPLEIDRGGLNLFREIKTLFKLRNIIRQVAPDIIHNIALKPVLYGGIVTFFSSIKSVNLIAGLGAIFASKNIKARVLKPIVKLILQGLFSKSSCRIIVQNSVDKKVLIEQLAINNKKVVLIKGSGIDIKQFSPSAEPEGKISIALVSRLLWDKGIREFVSAVKYLKQEKGLDFSAHLIGAPDSENLASVNQQQLDEWHQSGMVNCLGHTENIAEVWRNNHIAVLPSYREGLPKSLLEAAACGRPIVTTDTAGCNEIVKQGVNGLLVPIRNDQALAEAIEKLIVDKALRTKMGLKGREMVENEFSDQMIIEQTLQVYRELL